MLTIITPNLDSADYLEENILAIERLSIPHEHIIIDGGSRDGSLEIIKKYPHVRLLRQNERSGMYGAIHQAIEASKGEFITYINADDRIIPEGFEVMYNEIATGKYDFVYSDGYLHFIHGDLKEFVKGRRFGKYFLTHGCMPTTQPSIIFTKELYDAVGGLRSDRFKICGDFDLFLRMARLRGSKFRYLPITSSLFMKHGDSLGDRNTDRYYEELKENNLPTPSLLTRILYRIFKYI